jgi:hypothetical protein
MVNVEEFPALIDAGLAAILTVGAAAEEELLKLEPPQPATTSRIGSVNSIANGEKIQLRER